MLFRQILKYSEDMKWPVSLSTCNYISAMVDIVLCTCFSGL